MNDARVLPDWDAPPQVRTLVTTRLGGCSGGPYASLNLATHVGDDLQRVTANRRRLPDLAPDLPGDPLWLEQVHGTRVVPAEEYRPGSLADACVARTPGLVCTVLTADCLPVLLCDDEGSTVGAVHAGWRGLSAGVIEACIAAMALPPVKLMAWLGPAIGPQAYQVGEEVRAEFVAHDAAAAAAFVDQGQGKWLCDLYLLARQRLKAKGVSRVAGGKDCTFSDPKRFFSYRRDGVTGRMATCIWIAPVRNHAAHPV